MSKYSQKLKLLTVGTVLFSLGVVASAVATAAWYNLLDIAVISNLNLKIDVSDAKLDLYLTAKNSGEKIKLDDDHPNGFTEDELGIKETVLTDVSGMYESEWKNTANPETDVPRFHTRYQPNVNQRHNGFISEEEVKKSIVQAEFFFCSENYDMDVYLDSSTSFTANSTMNYDAAKEKAKKHGYSESDSNFETIVGGIKDRLDKAIYAARLSFYSSDGYYIINPHKGEDVIDGEVETYYGGVLDLNKDGFIDYNSNKEILYGELIDDSVPVSYSGVGTSDDDYKKDVLKYNTFEGEHKNGVQIVDWNAAKENVRIENSQNLKRYTFDSIDPLTRRPICHVNRGEEKRVIMSIYVEGWDRHMTDDIESASFDVNIAFTATIR